MSFSGPADNFSNLLRRNQAFSPSKIYDVIRFHLNEVYSSSSGEANKVHTLYQQYYPFIVMGLNNIRNAIEEVSHSEPCELLKTYDLLLRCLKNLKPWLNWSVLSEHWGTYIKSLMVRNDISTTRKEIRAYMEFLGHLDRQCQCQVAIHRFPNMNVWAANLMQLQSHSGRLHPTIFITIQSLILDGHTKDILCDKGDSLLEPMTLIANARVEREKGVHGLDSCLANLDNAIDSLHKCKVKANDLGSLYFLQAQALCLRALSRYENCNSKKIIWCKQNFTEDIEKVLKLVTNTYFSELAAKYMCLSNYINKLFCLVIDVLMTEHDENDHGLIEKIISLCDPNCDVGMLWQFKSHHSHLKSELIDDYFAENCNFSMEEGGRSEEPERMVSNIAIKVTKSLKSRCREAHFYYDQGERMLLMGKMTKEATILELIGDKLMAMSALEWGKGLSLQRGPSFYLGRFHAAISRIYRKAQDINEAKKELRQAEELRRCVSCKSCQLLLKLEISKESAKQKRKFGTTWDITSAMQEFLSVEVLLKMQLNAKPSRKGHKNSKYGCRCWECTCRFSLLSLLKEKGKDYVFKDETSNARDVFLENICLVVSLSSLPSSESPMTLSMLFELVKRTEIKVVHATHIAELIYIISWVACTKGKSDGDFSIPSETLIATLKHALILSSETPELLKKVAQLLAIMYLPGYFNEPPLSISTNSLTQCYLRLTTSSDVDLNDFVSKFYTQLQPHTILVINILGDKYKKLLWKLPFYVPCEHVSFLMISRFSSTRIPLFYLFQVNSKGSGRPGELWKAPWGTDMIVDTILPDFKWIVKDFEDGISA
ncbi:hypothetical protein Tco_0830388, partial [Tanacetum coccineum]